MLSDKWRDRAFSQDEAAALADIHPVTLRSWIHRTPAMFFSEKRKSRRWFSAQDITIVRVANELERGGMVMLTAVATAFEQLQEPPAPNSILQVKNGAITTSSARIITDADVAALEVDHSFQLIPIGLIAARAAEACAEKSKDGVHVAI